MTKSRKYFKYLAKDGWLMVARKKGADEQIAVALAGGSTIANAAKRSGVSERTISRRLTEPEHCASQPQRMIRTMSRSAASAAN